MARTLTDIEMKTTSAFLDKAVTPKIQKLVDQVNEVLKQKGVRVGADITWVMDGVDDETSKTDR